MGLHGRLPLLAVAALASACAAAPPLPVPPSEGRPSTLPETFSSLPSAVVAGRAVFELESGDAGRVARARCLLLSLDPQALDAWMLRASAAPENGRARRSLLSVLADRGESTEGFSAGEEVGACIDLMMADVPGRRGSMMAAVRIRGMGDRGLPPLFAEARAGGERGAASFRLLRMLGIPDRDLPVVHP